MNFMKTFWAALLAFIAANILLFLLTILIFASMASFMTPQVPAVKENSVLHIDLSGGLNDSPVTSPIEFTGMFGGGLSMNTANTLYQALGAIERAGEDDRIKGIYINVKGGASISHYEELRQAVERFKESGKFVVAYNETYGTGDYYFSTVADGVYMNPEGGFGWVGLASQIMFFKKTLDKLGVEMQILRHGTFKSAVEPYMVEKMSPANRLQYEELLGTVWGAILEKVSEARGISKEKLSEYADNMIPALKGDALECGFVDGLVYEDQVLRMLSKLCDGMSIEEAFGAATDEGAFLTDTKENAPELITLSDYIYAGSMLQNKTSKNKIAIVYADGEIVDGESSNGIVGGSTMVERLAKVRMDDKVKAVVFRVNSPGGSALASELMWREIELIRKQKPVIISMGSLAASGGYYISAPGDVILANRTTLTGSIGVFGMIPYIGKALEDKLGVTVDVVKTNKSADLSVLRKLMPDEQETILKSIKEVYDTFVGHVADGRNMTYDEVDAIGEGRVWSGVSAIDIGLIDGFGGLHEAIALAAERAELGDDFRVWEAVDEPDGLAMLLKVLGVEVKSDPLPAELAGVLEQYNAVKNLVSDGPSIQARMPYTMEIR